MKIHNVIENMLKKCVNFMEFFKSVLKLCPSKVVSLFVPPDTYIGWGNPLVLDFRLPRMINDQMLLIVVFQ